MQTPIILIDNDSVTNTAFWPRIPGWWPVDPSPVAPVKVTDKDGKEATRTTPYTADERRELRTRRAMREAGMSPFAGDGKRRVITHDGNPPSSIEIDGWIHEYVGKRGTAAVYRYSPRSARHREAMAAVEAAWDEVGPVGAAKARFDVRTAI